MNYQKQTTYLRKRLQEARRTYLKTPTKLPLSEWAEQNFVLGDDSALPGKFTFDRAEFQREVWDVIGDPKHKRVVIKAASQTMKTQAVLVGMAFQMAEDPSPTLVVNSTGELTEAFSKTRLTPMYETVPILKGLINPSRQRDSGNTIHHKIYPGGYTKLTTSNSVTGLSSLAIRYLFCDEVSRYIATTEGDSVALAEKRTTTYANRKILLVSSPAEEDNCKITDEFKNTDQRHFHIPCPHCKVEQELEWASVKWWDNDPQTAQIECQHCHKLWTESDKNESVRHGRWIASHPENEIPGFAISALYSSFVSIRELAEEFLAAKATVSTEKLQTFITTRLNQVWRNQSVSVGDIDFTDRLEDYTPDTLPNGVAIITAGVDTQKDRLEMSVWGFGIGDESWLVEHIIFHGSPDTPAVWVELAEFFKVRYTRQDGTQLPIHTFSCDSGGLSTQSVVRWCNKHYRRRVYAIFGRAGSGNPIFPPQSTQSKHGGKIYRVGVDTAKALWYSQLQVPEPGAGYVHFPDSLLDYPEYFEQIVAEKWRPKYKSGRQFKEWYATGATEALDTRVYCMASRESIKLDITKRSEKLDKKAEEVNETMVEDSISREEAVKTVNKKKRNKRKNKKRTGEWGSNYK